MSRESLRTADWERAAPAAGRYYHRDDDADGDDEDGGASPPPVECVFERVKLPRARDTGHHHHDDDDDVDDGRASAFDDRFGWTIAASAGGGGGGGGGGASGRRPVSYPWGPEARIVEDAPLGFDPAAKRASDPPPARPSKNQKAQVKPFTKESLERLERKTVQLIKEYGFQPRRKLSVEDGSRLPAKYEPFPKKLYGRPLEEIDSFIYDEVQEATKNTKQYKQINETFKIPCIDSTWGYATTKLSKTVKSFSFTKSSKTTQSFFLLTWTFCCLKLDYKHLRAFPLAMRAISVV